MRLMFASLLLFLSTFSVAELKISEVLYDTPGTDTVEEWIELYNAGCDSLNLNAYSISDNSGSFALSGSLNPGDYFVVAKNTNGFEALYNSSPDMTGMSLSLGNSGDYIELYNGGNLIDLVAWESGVSGWSLNAIHASIYRTVINNSASSTDWAVSATDSPGNGSLSQNCGDSGSTGNATYDGDYYDDVIHLSGSSLRSALHTLLENDHIRLSYAEVWDALQDTDEDPSNTNNVILLYTGRSHSKDDRDGQTGFDNQSWNREHVWPKSVGFPLTSQYAYSDIHHLRPADKTVNSSRGTKDFDEGGSAHSEAANTYTDTDSWEPRDNVKGDIARMLFYMDVRYDGSDGNTGDLYLVNNTSSATGDNFFGVLCTMYSWHAEDPVDQFEMTRNDRIQTWQGNRNPFIDHPEWASEFFGSECD